MTITTASGSLKGAPSVSATGRWSVANNLLKEVYPLALRDLVNNWSALLEYVQMRNDFQVDGGAYHVIPVKTAREQGHNAHAESGALPDPINASVERATYTQRELSGRIKLSGRSMTSTATTRGAFLKNFEFKITSLAASMARDLNRQMFGDASGRLCQIVSGATTTSIVVNNPGGFANSGPGTQYLEEGMRIAFVSSTGVLRTGTHPTITAIDRDSNTVTLSGAVATSANGDYVVRISNSSATSTNDSAYLNEVFGLAALVDDGNPWPGSGSTTNLVGQLSRETTGSLVAVPRWRSSVRDNGGVAVPFHEDMANQIMDDIDIAAGTTVQMFMTTHGIRRQWVAQQVAAKRFTSLVLESGYKSISHAGIPVIPDRDCTKGRIYALNFDCLYMFIEKDWDFIDADGAVLHRLEDYHSFQATLYRFHEFGTDAPNTMGRIEDIQDDF